MKSFYVCLLLFACGPKDDFMNGSWCADGFCFDSGEPFKCEFVVNHPDQLGLF